jgi:hypothetical protein
MQMRACETGVVVQGCVSRTADARQSQSAGPADTLHPGFVAFARAASFSMGEAAYEEATRKMQGETKPSFIRAWL